MISAVCPLTPKHLVNAIKESHNQTEEYMRTVRDFKMTLRGSTILCVEKDMNKSIVPMVNAICAIEPVNQLSYKVIDSAQSAMSYVECMGKELRVVIVSAHIDRGVDGLQLAEWILEEHRSLPVILSASNENEVQEARERMPYVDIFLKGSLNVSDLMSLFCVRNSKTRVNTLA